MKDVGLEALKLLRDALMLEDGLIVDRQRGLSWKAHNLLQHIDASPVFESRGTDVSLITVKTPIVRAVKRDADETLQVLLDLNRFAVGSAITLDSETHCLTSVLAHQVHEGTIEFRVKQIYLMALLQLTHAENSGESLALVFDGEIARDTGTLSPLNEAHEILSLPSELITPEMAFPSRFADRHELQSVYQMVEGSPFQSDGWWEGGISIEVPFGTYDTSLIELRNDISHPSLGAGLAVRTTLRTEFVDIAPARLAVDLQRLQMTTVDGGGQLGAWGLRSDLDFAHVAWSRFIPNVLFMPGLTADVAMGEVNRAVWCDEILFPGLPPRNASMLIGARNILRADAAKGGIVA